MGREQRSMVAEAQVTVDAEKFWRDGYLLLPGVFAPAKVAEWRTAALAARGDIADLLSNDRLSDIILDPRILSIARQIFAGDPVYFSDSNFWIGPQVSEYHKDNADRYDVSAPDWAVERYPIIRFGLYTEPHGELPDGLDLRIGSHRVPDTTTGSEFSPPVSPGDLVVWNMRTTHSACSRILKLVNYRLTPQSLLSRAIGKLSGVRLLRKHPQERVAFFFSYGLRSPSLDRYMRYLKTRAYAVEGWAKSDWSPATRRLIEKRGLSVIDMTGHEPQPMDGPVNVQHRPIPY